MGVADELEKLSRLHESGELSDEEFEKAKAAVLRGVQEAQAGAEDDTLLGGMFGGDGKTLSGAANRYVNYQIVMGAIGLLLFLVIACTVIGNFNRPFP